MLMSDNVVLSMLRTLHIGAGVFWVGGVLFLNLFIFPALKDAGPDAPRVMGWISRGGRLQTALLHSGTLTVLAGFALYGWFIMQTGGEWARSAPAMGYGVGAIAASVAYGLALFVSAPSGKRLQAIGREAAAAKAPPAAGQQAEIARLHSRMTAASRAGAVLLVISVIAMSVSRYLA